MRWDPRQLPKPTAHVRFALSYSLLIAPVVAFIYSVVLPISAPNAVVLVGKPSLSLLVIGWLLTTLVLVQHQAKSERAIQLVSLSIYLIVFAAYIAVTLGGSSPVVFAWPLAGLLAFALAGFRGYGFAAVTLLLGSLAPLALLDCGVTSSTIIINFLSVIFVSLGLIFIYVTALDTSNITEKSNIGSRHDRLSAIINNLADAIISTDKVGKITLYNSACLNLLDTNQSLDRVFIDDVVSLQTNAGDYVSLFSILNKLSSVRVSEDYFIAIDDERIQLEITMSPIRHTYTGTSKDADKSGYVLIIRDITHEKSLEQEKDEFISVVSHELRTPIAIAEGTISNAQILIGRDKKLADKAGEPLKLAHEQIIFLAKMINDLSTLSRAERGFGEEAIDINIKALVDDMFAEYAPQAKQAGLTMNLDSLPGKLMVHTSELYLQELMQNFITNAIKYTKEGSITLMLSHSNDVVTFAVKDTGIGISKADQKHIYEKFFRSEDYRTRETGGTGLGLYVAAKLADKIGTKIELKSRLNHGSTFSITLPIAGKRKS